MSYYDIIHTIESFDDAFSLMQYTVQKMKECNLAPGDIEDYIYDAISKDNMHLVECSKKILYKCILEEQKNNNFNNNDLYTYYDDSNWYNDECYNDECYNGNYINDECYNDECYNDECYNGNYINDDGYHLSLFDHDISSDYKHYDYDGDIYEGYNNVSDDIDNIPYNTDFENEIHELYFV